MQQLFAMQMQQQSPSSQRAWIEIGKRSRNCSRKRSPSSQRAWIEISRGRVDLLMLLSPSSQRAWIEISKEVCNVCTHSGRPPRRGRG